jgi:hypothetical protein
MTSRTVHLDSYGRRIGAVYSNSHFISASVILIAMPAFLWPVTGDRDGL